MNFRIFFGLISLSILGFRPLMAQESPLIINAYYRQSTTLNGQWRYIIDPYENGFYNYRYQPFEDLDNPGKGAYFSNAVPSDKSDLVEYDYEKSDYLHVPGDWNSQKTELLYYEGTIWYRKAFEFNELKEGNRLFLYFGAINYEADVYLNGKKLGKHIGGFTPFNYEISDLVTAGTNYLVVKVDNKRKRDGVPTLNTDWWNYGGITRDVKLIAVPKDYITDYFVQLDPENPKIIKGHIQLTGDDIANKSISIQIPELKINQSFVTNKNGRTNISIPVKKISYWSPENPRLYTVRISSDKDSINDRIGFRTIDTKGQDILLNGQSIYLKGISIHEENGIKGGRANSIEDARLLLGWAKDMGCNFVRLAHYPHNEHMIRLADEMGIMVWEENPVYWTILWDNPATFENASNQLLGVMSRDKNRAATIVWSMANETPTSDSRNMFLKRLADQARATDPTRLISAALEQSSLPEDPLIKVIDDPFAKEVDLLSFNQYIGWYDGLPEKAQTVTWKISQNKPVFISEFGAGALQGYHGDKLTRWTEEFQESLYNETLAMLKKIPQFRGASPWILVDFRSPRRQLPDIQDGYNRKGLISEKGIKKKAYYVMQDFYMKWEAK